MKGLLRALLFGAGLSFALVALVSPVFLLSPETAPPTTDGAWVVVACSAFASPMAIWRATRLPATASWLIAIIGWIVGFNVAIFVVEIVFIAVSSL